MAFNDLSLILNHTHIFQLLIINLKTENITLESLRPSHHYLKETPMKGPAYHKNAKHIKLNSHA